MLLKNIGLFCKRALEKRRYSAKETYHFKEPTNRSLLIVATLYTFIHFIEKIGTLSQSCTQHIYNQMCVYIYLNHSKSMHTVMHNYVYIYTRYWKDRHTVTELHSTYIQPDVCKHLFTSFKKYAHSHEDALTFNHACVRIHLYTSLAMYAHSHRVALNIHKCGYMYISKNSIEKAWT